MTTTLDVQVLNPSIPDAPEHDCAVYNCAMFPRLDRPCALAFIGPLGTAYGTGPLPLDAWAFDALHKAAVTEGVDPNEALSALLRRFA